MPIDVIPDLDIQLHLPDTIAKLCHRIRVIRTHQRYRSRAGQELVIGQLCLIVLPETAHFFHHPMYTRCSSSLFITDRKRVACNVTSRVKVSSLGT